MKCFSAPAFFLLLAVSFQLSTVSWAQESVDEQSLESSSEVLPDQPLQKDELNFEEGPPQEPPFTQTQDEFQEFDQAAESPAQTPPVVTSPVPRPAKVKSSEKGVRYIEHPLAAKGLLRIEKDGSYIYKTQEFTHSQSATLRLGSLQPPQIASADGQTDFKTMYTKENIPLVMFDYEWQPLSAFGKLGLQAGLGFFTSQGNGRFLDGAIAKEKYTFLAFPLSLGAVYRMQFMSRQWVAPYIAGGGTYFAMLEMRDDDKPPHGVGVPGAYGAGGVLFSISALDRESAFTMRNDYGVTNMWLSVEYRYIKTFAEDIDLSSSLINAGLAFDY